jgi:hypothetical protein
MNIDPGKILSRAVALFLIASSAFGLDPGRSKGSVLIGGSETAMRFAYGRHQKVGAPGTTHDLITILLTSSPLTPETLLNYGDMTEMIRLGQLATMRVEMDDQLHALRTQICGRPCVTAPRGSVDVHPTLVSHDVIEAVVSQPDVFKVSFRAVLGDENYAPNPAASHETPALPPPTPDLTSTEPEKRLPGGVSLPRGGGEPGRIYLAYADAVRKGNIDAVSRLLASPPPFAIMPALQAMQRSNPEIVSGVVKGDNAVLKIKGIPKEPGASPIGVILLTKVNGGWKIVTEDWMPNEADYIAGIAAIEREKVAPLRSGSPLPDGGGEPGNVWRAYDQALTRGDLAALKKVMTSAEAAELKTVRDLEMLKEFRPTTIRLIGGLTDGLKATLQLTGTPVFRGGSKIGSITLVREKGQWKVAVGEDWSAGH